MYLYILYDYMYLLYSLGILGGIISYPINTHYTGIYIYIIIYIWGFPIGAPRLGSGYISH